MPCRQNFSIGWVDSPASRRIRRADTVNKQQKVALGIAVYAASRSKTGLGFVARALSIWLAMILFCFLLGFGISFFQHVPAGGQGTTQTK